jgi:hypothetical protein
VHFHSHPGPTVKKDFKCSIVLCLWEQSINGSIVPSTLCVPSDSRHFLKCTKTGKHFAAKTSDNTVPEVKRPWAAENVAKWKWDWSVFLDVWHSPLKIYPVLVYGHTGISMSESLGLNRRWLRVGIIIWFIVRSRVSDKGVWVWGGLIG